MKQTLSDNFFNWFGSVKEWFQSVFGSDENAKDKSFYERYWWVDELVVAIMYRWCCSFIQ
jgi:hypothetical protein